MAAALRDSILVAAVGNRWLKDQGFGLHVVDRLSRVPLPPGVELFGWEAGIIAAFQRLCERTYGHAVFISAVSRGREPGTLHQMPGEFGHPSDAEIHGRIGDSVMGLVSLENLLVIARHYGRVPVVTLVIEAEPVDDTWGDDLSPPVARLVQPTADAVVQVLQRWRASCPTG